MEKFSELDDLLKSHEKIITNFRLENAICKIMNPELVNLNRIEESTVSDLILNNSRGSNLVEIVDKNLFFR